MYINSITAHSKPLCILWVTLTHSSILWYVTDFFIKLLLYNCLCLLPGAVCGSQRVVMLSVMGW